MDRIKSFAKKVGSVAKKVGIVALKLIAIPVITVSGYWLLVGLGLISAY